MIFHFPHCAVLVAADAVSTLFPDLDHPEDETKRLLHTLPVHDDVRRMVTMEVMLAAHLTSYAIRGTPSPGAFLRAGGSLTAHPLYAKRVEASFDPVVEAQFVEAFVRVARGESTDTRLIAPLIAKLPRGLADFVDRFTWFMLAPNYVTYMRV